ncbi:MAG: hypothetical protein JWM41_864 [Gemmatimonadetes bacterium]|nr:hypothetical protein [Gemmatimonadota bacterium]
MAHKLTLEPSDHPPVEQPRGRMVDAKAIVEHFYTVEENGVTKRQVSARWVREHMPYKMPMSHSRVFWYLNDVVEILAESRRLRIPIKEVTLPHLERAG